MARNQQIHGLLLAGLLLAGLLLIACEPPRAPSCTFLGLVRQRIERDGKADVLINLRASERRTSLQTKRLVLDALGPHFGLRHRYANVPALSGTLFQSGLDILSARPEVTSVQLDEPGMGHLAQSVPLLGADVVHLPPYAWTGKAVRVAVLDTGIDTDHPDLSDHLVAQQCFTNGACPPSNSDQGPSAEDDHGHGTIISGIITSNGTVSPTGFAPDAEIVAVRVLDSNNQGAPGDWVAGLDWVLTNQATLQVDIVNLSLGTWNLYTGNCDANQPALASAISQLIAQGVVVFASVGNQGSGNAIEAPACISGVLAVGATYDADLGRQPSSGTYSITNPCFDATTGPDVIACFTNSSTEMDLVAPGSKITAANVGGGQVTNAGTSLSAPIAAGVASLLLECEPTLSPAEMEAALEQSGPLLTDPKNGLQFPSINALSAVNQICPGVPPIDMGLPDAGLPDLATPDAATPDLATPDGATPDMATPDLATPDGATPDMATPDGATPDLATPDGATPDVATPDVATPDGATPDGATPDLATPDLTTPDGAMSDTAALDLTQLDRNTGPTTEQTDDSGCGCSVRGDQQHPDGFLALALIFLLLRCSRRGDARSGPRLYLVPLPGRDTEPTARTRWRRSRRAPG